jgi:hypothetical protein
MVGYMNLIVQSLFSLVMVGKIENLLLKLFKIAAWIYQTCWNHKNISFKKKN